MRKDDDLLIEQMENFSEFTRRLEDAKRRASIDALTGLASRGKGEAYLRIQLEAGQPMTVILIDLDRFKRFNDRWGHICGDQILRHLSQVLAEYSEEFDIICRWEGDKFLMISQVDQKDTEEKASSLRIRLCKRYTVAQGDDSVEVDVSVSVGVAQSKDGEPLEDLFARAQADLYSNRNRILQTTLHNNVNG